MAFMKKDVNLGLLLLIIATLLLFSGFTVYYQTNFKNVVTEYRDKLEQLKGVTSELSKEKTRLNETYQLRTKAEKDIKALDEQYRLLSDEKEQLESDKKKLQDELSSAKSQVAETEAKLSQKETLLSQAQASLSAANAEIDVLKDRYDSLKAKKEALCEKYPSESEWNSGCS